MRRESWLADVRSHLALASVTNSTLMMQSTKGRVGRAQQFLLTEVPLDGLSNLNEADFLKFLNQTTDALSLKLLRIEDSQPNWGAARKVLNIYLRLCTMNKDLHPAFKLSNLEPFLEVPLDNHVIGKIDAAIKTGYASKFAIKNLTLEFNTEIQASALKIADEQGLYRYELDALYWNAKKLA